LGLIKAWQQLFDLVRPDAVLLDHSPTAIFASRGRSFYRATMGSLLHQMNPLCQAGDRSCPVI
jgi:hypothetical protein